MRAFGAFEQGPAAFEYLGKLASQFGPQQLHHRQPGQHINGYIVFCFCPIERLHQQLSQQALELNQRSLGRSRGAAFGLTHQQAVIGLLQRSCDS